MLSDSAIKTPEALYLTSIATVSRLFGQIEQLATLTMRHLQEESGAETSTHSANARNTLLIDLLDKIASTVKALAAQPSWALYDSLIKLVKGDKRCGRFIECFFFSSADFSVQTSSKLSHENKSAALSAEMRSSNDQILLAIGNLASALRTSLLFIFLFPTVLFCFSLSRSENEPRKRDELAEQAAYGRGHARNRHELTRRL